MKESRRFLCISEIGPDHDKYTFLAIVDHFPNPVIYRFALSEAGNKWRWLEAGEAPIDNLVRIKLNAFFTLRWLRTWVVWMVYIIQ